MENGVTENQMPEKIAKVEVASSSLVTRSILKSLTTMRFVGLFSLAKWRSFLSKIGLFCEFARFPAAYKQQTAARLYCPNFLSATRYMPAKPGKKPRHLFHRIARSDGRLSV